MSTRAELNTLYLATRSATEDLAALLSAEDQQLQSMADASPTKWHRAHTTWFVEKIVLEPHGYPAFDPRYGALFNSYYDSFGPRHPRPARGLLSRPSADEVSTYRLAIDQRVTHALHTLDDAALASLVPQLHLAIAHEEQHQELILTDILSAFATSPLEPAYRPLPPVDEAKTPAAAPAWQSYAIYEGGLFSVGARDDAPFAFDHELPRHKVWVEPFELAHALVTVEAVEAFVRDGGYHTPSLWLAQGYERIRAQGIEAPLYVSSLDGVLSAFGLHGRRMLSPNEPASHLSFYEADALARYLGARLPTEVEWELAADPVDPAGHFAEMGVLHPLPPLPGVHGVRQLFGDAWEWTRSSYEPYPGYEPLAGAVGEYNGKFMAGQQVVRGGSCLTPARHVRASYRNYWPPETRFQMTGLRLAKDIGRRT